MPLSVEVKINGTLIETLHIGRLDELKTHEQVSEYLVSPNPYFDRDKSDRFTHKYSDGALVCVQKALEVWNAK